MKVLGYFLICCAIFQFSFNAFACTSAIVSGNRTINGRPLLWKNRDTGEEDNKIERIEATDSTYEYIAIFNASDSLCREAWMGYNSQGFAVMNTASYNIKDDNFGEMDKEGLLMTKALQRCRTIDDFQALLRSLPKPLGVEANFGVIDATGDGAYFETNNYEFVRFDLKDSPNGVLTRSNYSYSGREGDGYGYIREQNAIDLIEEHITNNNFTPAVFTEKLSRTFYHSKLNTDFTHSDAEWIIDQDFIPRRTSTATIVIEGVAQGESPYLTMMWVGLGYPPCSSIRAVWLGEGGVPEELRGIGVGGHSPLCDLTVKKKHEVFSLKRGSGKYYLNLQLLYNRHGNGYCQKALVENVFRYEQGYAEREKRAKNFFTIH